MEQALVTLTIGENEPRMNSRVVAKGLGIQHKNFMETLRTYEKELVELGSLPFETEPKTGARAKAGGDQPKYATLNENQVVFAVTLSRNTPKVVEFKLALVKAFSMAREIIQTLKFCPDADLIGLSPRQVRAVGLIGQVIEADRAGQPYDHLWNRFIHEIEAITSDELPWGSSPQPVKMLK